MKKIKEPKRTSNKLKLNEINELKMCLFIVKREAEVSIKTDIEKIGGRVLSVVPASGISHSSMFEVIKSISEPCIVVFAIARKEDAHDLIGHISLKYEIYAPGNGRAFAIDIDGYLGAKALFL